MADVLEVPLGTLKSRLFRARLALREQTLKNGATLPHASSNGQKAATKK